MVPTNEFIVFCPTDTGTNLQSQATYIASTDRVSGNKPGVAISALNNKALRQANALASQVAQLVSNKTGTDMLDNGVSAQLLAQITAALAAYPPVLTRYTSGTGAWNATFIFHIASGSATIGATYTNNSVTYTVKATVAAGVVIQMTGNGAPAVSGTLTKASGTGDSTLTFYAVRSAIYLVVEAAGAGGSGGGVSTSSGTSGAAGGNTTFGTSLITAGGGSNSGTGNGGTPTVNSPAQTIIAAVGGQGGIGLFGGTAAIPSSPSGTNPLGGGARGVNGSAGEAGAANTGAGGSGGSTGGGTGSGGGESGGAGAYVKAYIPSPAATYNYSIAPASTGGTGTYPGGNGAAGMATVTEYFQ